jgi:hypothetical protein
MKIHLLILGASLLVGCATTARDRYAAPGENLPDVLRRAAKGWRVSVIMLEDVVDRMTPEQIEAGKRLVAERDARRKAADPKRR